MIGMYALLCNLTNWSICHRWATVCFMADLVTAFQLIFCSAISALLHFCVASPSFSLWIPRQILGEWVRVRVVYWFSKIVSHSPIFSLLNLLGHRFHNSSLLQIIIYFWSFSDYKTLKMRCRQIMLTNVCSFCCIVFVVHKVSHPYSITNFTFDWKIVICFSDWFLLMPNCWTLWNWLVLCQFWWWHLYLCNSICRPHFTCRQSTQLPWWALHPSWMKRRHFAIFFFCLFRVLPPLM